MIYPSRRHSNSKWGNNRDSKYKKQKLIEPRGKIEKYKIIIEDFNTLLSAKQNYKIENQQDRTKHHPQKEILNFRFLFIDYST